MTRVSSETRAVPLESGSAQPAVATGSAWREGGSAQPAVATGSAWRESGSAQPAVATGNAWRENSTAASTQAKRVAVQEATLARPAPARTHLATTADVAQPAPARAQAQHAPNTIALATDLSRWEGSTRHMYVDTRGHVTTGIGHLLRDANAAVALPWLHRSTGAPATPAEIRTAFARVAAQPAGQQASHYERLSDLVLPPNMPRDLAGVRLHREFLPGIRRLCPNFDRYPQPAQRALVDMAYTLGVGGLGRFSNMLRACERGDFAAAGNECHRRTCRDDRNEATRELFMAAEHLTNALQALLHEVRP
jgi:GH24 family phage-related lysozyme (muramidase)